MPTDDRPRTWGPLSEQLYRVVTCLTIADSLTTKPMTRHRVLMLGVHAGRAIADQLIGNQLGNQEQRTQRSDEMKTRLTHNVRFFKLVRDLRDRDFHESTVMPPIPGTDLTERIGRTTLTSRQGKPAQIQGIGPDSLETAPGNSNISHNRPIACRNGQVIGGEAGVWTDLRDVLDEYTRSILPFIEESEGPLSNAGMTELQGDE